MNLFWYGVICLLCPALFSFNVTFSFFDPPSQFCKSWKGFGGILLSHAVNRLHDQKPASFTRVQHGFESYTTRREYIFRSIHRRYANPVYRYALDIRMLANRQVAIIDAACSLFQPSRTAPPPEPSLILSLPRLEELVDTVISNLSSTPSSTPSPTSLYSIGKGLRCSESLAKTALRGLHESVLEVLLELS